MEPLRIGVVVVVLMVVAAGAILVLQEAPSTGAGVATTTIEPIVGAGGGTGPGATGTGTNTTTTTITVTTEASGAAAGDNMTRTTSKMIVVNLDTPYAKRLMAKAEEGAYQVAVVVELPNPCYNASLSYISENNTIRVDLESPPPKVMCVQVVKEETLGTVKVPAGADVKIIVAVDGVVKGKQQVSLP